MNPYFNQNPDDKDNTANTQNNNPHGFQPQNTEQPSTPYQTPVRGSDEMRSESEPHTQSAPFEPGTYSYQTYHEWQKQQNASKKKRNFKKPLMALGGVAAAVLLFAGGISLGANGFPFGDTNANNQTSTNEDLPTLTISATPSSDTALSSDGKLNGEQIYAKVNPSIVAIQSMDSTGQNGSTGSGVVMSEDGYIVTNAHVILDTNTGAAATNISVMFSDGSQASASVIGADEQTDLAVIKVNTTTDLTPAEFGDSDKLKVGEKAYAIGSPGGLQLANSMTSGIISAINRNITVNDRVMSLIQTDVTINPGNSGGALINEYGQVIGITSAKLGISYYEGLGFAIPLNSAKEIVDELIVNGYIAGRPSIGITGQNISQQVAQFRNLPIGVEVASVDSRAKAASEGLMPYDVITAVNGQTITTMDEINEIKEGMKAGDTIRLTIYRPSAQKSMDLTITLTDAHDLEGTDPATQQQQQQYTEDYSNYFNPYDYFFGY